ncbi:lipid kinase [Ammoniphilus oxalaticus]|uniref:Lipid kinase n=1 Tax=Ammoniphilus oxalaticus TaxID=66863 RepID=A0A419SDK6_9BACL|nr:diacylglycerol kinase [Ammoniphilus oxalaticus]RKD21070.1 lipid kinase [Ammoniphilus oxalaticus]
MKRARLIYNPSSGREEFQRRLPEVLDLFEQVGYETSCHATKGAGDASLAASLAIERNFDLIIAAGGDGTLHEVVNGMAERDNRPPLGIIPAGTTNDFARALGLPLRNVLGASRSIIEGQPRAVDIGKINNRYFINIAGGGALTDLTYEVPTRLKTLLGQLAYYIKGIEKLPFIRPSRVRIETDEQIIDEEITLFLISNSNSVGGLEKVAPHADLTDGLFDCIILRKTSLPDLVRIATNVIRGDHIKDPQVIYFQTKQLKVTSSSQVMLNLDGELGGQLPMSFSVLPQHIEVIMPQEQVKI